MPEPSKASIVHSDSSNLIFDRIYAYLQDVFDSVGDIIRPLDTVYWENIEGYDDEVSDE